MPKRTVSFPSCFECLGFETQRFQNMIRFLATQHLGSSNAAAQCLPEVPSFNIGKVWYQHQKALGIQPKCQRISRLRASGKGQDQTSRRPTALNAGSPSLQALRCTDAKKRAQARQARIIVHRQIFDLCNSRSLSLSFSLSGLFVTIWLDVSHKFLEVRTGRVYSSPQGERGVTQTDLMHFL